MNNIIQWIDFKALERDDVDENFGLLSFIFWGTRDLEKRKWWGIIPILNLIYLPGFLISFITFPLRCFINASQLRKLRKNAYDIEDTYSDFRLIRNASGDIGLCEWGKSFEFSRKVLLPSQYAKIDRWGLDRFIVTDKNNKMGLFSSETCKWIFPCSCDNIVIESTDIINVTINNKSQRYNSKGDRIIR
ncbi:MAG: hypothetical protein IJX41_02150 [Bacteroidaceae bacterium]|nr:hypothetical protein [Bacteroidaceae bacterium]